MGLELCLELIICVLKQKIQLIDLENWIFEKLIGVVFAINFPVREVNLIVQLFHVMENTVQEMKCL